MKEVELNRIEYIYMLGIGGIGMSAVARYFHSQGKQVYGYDKVPSALTDTLQEEGIEISFDDETDKLPLSISKLKSAICLVIYTPAIPAKNKIYSYLINENCSIYKRADVLSMITAGHKVVAVAGTHGKTSVSTMIAHILKECNANTWAFLGGISSDDNTNFYHPTGKTAMDDESIIVVEADEYDRSFLKLEPTIAVITAIEADHLDIYGDVSEMERSFGEFSKRITSNGVLVKRTGLSVKSIRSTIEYSAQQPADVCARNIRVKDGLFHFDVHVRNEKFEDFVSTMPGRHNVENAIAAIIVCMQLGIGLERIKNALADFKGVKRRFETVFSSEEFIFIDDYAHHPSEIRAAIDGVKELYPDRHITGVFQPHLFSRTRDFASDFAKSLSALDDVLLLDIYPAREEAIPGVTSDLILRELESKGKIVSKKEVLDHIKNMNEGVIMTIGAGDIDRLLPRITEILTKKKRTKLIA